MIVRNFSQCGKSEQNMDWLKTMLEARRDPKLFYPDPDLAMAKAVELGRQLTRTTAADPNQVDRYVKWMYYQFMDPRPINLNPSKLAVVIASIVFNMYSR